MQAAHPPFEPPPADSADPTYASDRRLAARGLVDVPIVLDLRDHVVIAGAIGLAAGSIDPIRDGADDVAILSAALAARWPDQQAFSAEQIAAAPKPFGLRLPKWSRLYGAEARLNLCLWREGLTAAGGPTTPDAPVDVLDLLRRVAVVVGG